MTTTLRCNVPFWTLLFLLLAVPAAHAQHDLHRNATQAIAVDDLKYAARILKQAEAGVTHVNLMTSLSEPQLAFSGFKESGFGIPEAGRSGVRFFTDEKVAYVRYRRPEETGGV